MARSTYLKAAAAILLATAMAAALAILLLPRLLDLDRYQQDIQRLAQQALNRRVSYQSASFSKSLLPSIVFRGVTIAERSGGGELLRAEEVSFKLALLPLFHKELRLQQLIAVRPVLALSRDAAGVFNIDDLLQAKPSRFKLRLGSLHLRNARLLFSDRHISPEGFSATLEHLELDVNGLDRGHNSAFRLATTIADAEGPSTLSLSGTAEIAAEHQPISQTRVNASVAAKNLNAWPYWPYFARHLPFQRVRGRVDLDAGFHGKLTEFASRGKLRIRGLYFNYPQVFHAVLTPKEVRLSYELALTPRDFSVPRFTLDVDALRATGSCFLGDLHSNDLRITARAVTSPFRLEDFHQYIPYGVIVKGPADFIEQHIKGGVYRLDDGSLDGRVSQITHMELGTNYNVLHIRGRVEKGIVSYQQAPSFNDIKGELELKGKDFILRRMSGNFGGSPFTLDGRIADYPLHKPASYPFTMTATPAQAEVAWLLGQKEPADTSFTGKSTLDLAGAGTTADYRLSGAWELTGAKYRFRQVIDKPAGRPNNLRFSARLGKDEAQLEELRYELSPLEATVRARYRYQEPAPLSFSVVTNRFPAESVFDLAPGLKSYHPTGKLQVNASGSGNPAEPANMELKGEITLADCSAQPFAQVKPLSGVSGTIRLARDALETDRLSGSVGNTAIVLKGRLHRLAKPVAELTFSTPRLRPEDFGLVSAGKTPMIQAVSGSLAFQEGIVSVSSLTGSVNSTTFKMSGNWQEHRRPTVSLRLDFPHLVVEDLVALAALRPAGETKPRPEPLSLRARVTTTDGSFKDLHFQKLDTTLSLVGSSLQVDALRVGAIGGTVTGSGKADFAASGGPVYQARYTMQRVDAEKFQRLTGATPFLTGELSVEGELAIQGNNTAEFARTARTRATVHLEKAEISITLPPEQGGGVSRIPCQKLDAKLSAREQTFTIEQLQAAIFGGTVAGNAWADFAGEGWPSYQVHYRLEGVEAAQLQKAAGVKVYVSGKLSAGGDLTAKGSHWEELKKTGSVATELDLSNGVIQLDALGGGPGQAGQLPFKSLHTKLSVEKHLLTVRSTRMEALEGVITGEAEADFTTPERPGYRVDCQAEGLNAAQVLKAFQVKRELTGRLKLKAGLTARGTALSELEKTLQGTVELHFAKGVINKYATISKIFSILNVSQLLSFHLPDMVTTGMPYDRLDGTFTLKDGVASTGDLTLATPSINMAAVGTADLVSSRLDLVVGVELLQTIGKVVSRIPVVGWILTGSNKRFLVTYFDVKGDWNDPKVSAVPVSSISGGVTNIFKRILKLPAELVTKPGEVIIGK